MLRTLNFWTAMAAKSLRSIPGCFESRAQRFEGLSIMARNGQEATASRSRGSTGKLMRGSEKDGRARGPARTTPGATRFKAAVAATAAEVIAQGLDVAHVEFLDDHRGEVFEVYSRLLRVARPAV